MGIGADGLAILADALRACPGITSLTLNHNTVGTFPHGLNALCEALKVNCSLKNLNLSNNSLGPGGGAVIGDMLRINRALTNIDLSWNELGPMGGKSLLHGLEANPVVLALNLNGTHVSEETLYGVDLKLKENNLRLPHGSSTNPVPLTVITSPIGSPIVSPRGVSTATLPVDTIPTTRDHFPLSSGARLVRDDDVAHKLLHKERTCINVGEANLLAEATDQIHALQLDIDHHKKQRAHTEDKEQSTKKSFADREMRYSHHAKELEQINSKVHMDKERLAAESLHLHGEVERKHNEKCQTQQDTARVQDAARITADRLRAEVRNALQVKADLQAKLTNVKRCKEEEKDENARLRAHINRCKEDLGRVLH